MHPTVIAASAPLTILVCATSAGDAAVELCPALSTRSATKPHQAINTTQRAIPACFREVNNIKPLLATTADTATSTSTNSARDL